MLICLYAHITHPLEQFTKIWVVRQIPFEHQHIDEITNDLLQIHLWPICSGSSYRYIGLAAVARKQRLERGEQAHEKGDALTPAQLPKLPQKERRECKTIGTTL